MPYRTSPSKRVGDTLCQYRTSRSERVGRLRSSPGLGGGAFSIREARTVEGRETPLLLQTPLLLNT
eukprot:378997-Rhodomonas_salina.1